MDNQIRIPWLWIFFILLTAAGAVWFGINTMYANVDCPEFIRIILFVVAALMVVVMLIRAFVATNRGSATIFSTIISLVIIAVAVLGLAGIANLAFGKNQRVIETFCQHCTQRASAEQLYAMGNLDGASDLARECFRSSLVEEDRQWSARMLVDVALKKSNIFLDQGNCEASEDQIKEAISLAEQIFPGSDLLGRAKERYNTWEATCPIEPEPTEAEATEPPVPTRVIDVLRNGVTGANGVIDFRVYEGATMVEGLSRTQVGLMSGTTPIEIVNFAERSSDDPVCMILVADNSGSIIPGMGQIRNAVEAINQMRKSNDELGLVLFDETARGVVAPAKAAINTGYIDGGGDYTALWAGVETGLTLAGQCRSSYRYLLVLTDGVNNKPGPSHIQLRETAKAQGVSICTVGVASSQTLDEQSLQEVVNNCEYYRADNFDILASKFTEIFGELRSYYRVEFDKAYAMRGAILTLQAESATDEPVEFK